jgi:hypothetical protein
MTTAAILPPPTLDTVSDKEQAVDNVIPVLGGVAANWVHSPTAVNALSASVGLAPLAIHFAFFLAQIFHHSQKPVAAA